MDNLEKLPQEENLCRLCLGTSGVKISIFQDDFPHMINIVSDLQIDPLDDLPKQACINCAKQVKSAVLLRRRIIQSFRYLKNLSAKRTNDIVSVEEIIIITEPDSDGDSDVTSDQKEELNGSKIDTSEDLKSSNIQEYNEVSSLAEPSRDCSVCGKTFSSTANLKMHLRAHEGPVVCLFCGKTYAYSDSLNQHIRRCHKKICTVIICDVCGKKFNRAAHYNLHMKRHLGVKDVECTTCGQKFYSSEVLDRHTKQVHSKIKPYVCEYCKKSFPRREHLMVHFLTHSEETPFKCDFCNLRFKQKLRLKLHLRNIHKIKDKVKVLCPKCNKGFASEHALNCHSTKAHEKNKCTLCTNVFATKKYLNDHVEKVHSDLIKIE